MEDKTSRLTRVLPGLVATVAVLVLGVLMLGGPAKAAPGDAVWTEMSAGAEIVGPNLIKLTDGNTSVEAANLGWEVPFGSPISFKFVLGPGVTCAGGAPRVFVKIDDTTYNSFDMNPDNCGGTDEKVTFTVPAEGTITHAGVVFDNSQQGWLKVKNLKINGKLVDFTATEPTPEPTATATTSPSASPSATMNPTPTATATVTPPGDDDGSTGSEGGTGGESLPITGVKANVLFGVGVLLVLGGIGMLVVTRRRNRTRDDETSDDITAHYGSW